MDSFAIRTALGLAALAVTVTALAQAPQVYRYIDVDGRIVYSDRAPPSSAKDVQTKRVGANYVETSVPGELASKIASDRFPATLYTFECGEVCQNAEALLNRRGVPFTTVDVQKDEQGMIRMRTLTGEDRAPVLALGDKLIVNGFNAARWQAALDEAGYPKTPAPRRTGTGSRQEAPPSAPVEGTRSMAPPPRGGDYPKQ
ncbi:MAG: glutaredoxin family protein [Burkholderiales bacterium]|nr:glutaredoxin family protein [Burkholderiales bacterium]